MVSDTIAAFFTADMDVTLCSTRVNNNNNNNNNNNFINCKWVNTRWQ
jgi:hypothetical protein